MWTRAHPSAHRAQIFPALARIPPPSDAALGLGLEAGAALSSEDQLAALEDAGDIGQVNELGWGLERDRHPPPRPSSALMFAGLAVGPSPTGETTGK